MVASVRATKVWCKPFSNLGLFVLKEVPFSALSIIKLLIYELTVMGCT
jgi:hypothetical protein